MSMQDNGITNPSDEIKKITKTMVEKLSQLPLDEKVEVVKGSLMDSKGNVVVTFPDSLTK